MTIWTLEKKQQRFSLTLQKYHKLQFAADVQHNYYQNV